MLTRRQAIKSAALVTAAYSTVASISSAEGGAGFLEPPHPTPGDAFTLPPLLYAFDALEPHIDAQTMQIHHDKHHAAYVNNLNKAVAGEASLAGKTVEDLIRNLPSVPESVRTAVRNQGGGHYNHSLFWLSLKKNDSGKPQGELAKLIDKKFGGFPNFQQELTKAATSVFGSGWAWLTLDSSKELRIEPTPNQDSPLSVGRTPLFGIDVWEHAYYLKYQNKRPDYITAFYNVINWDFVGERYQKLVS
jgi:superoxide dismutase, Fe-Mn family